LCDYDNSRIRRIDRNGIITSPIGGGTIDDAIFPTALAFDRLGNLYVMELARQRIVRYNTNGTSNVVAGNGDAGYSGDGGPAPAATLSYPVSMAFDRAGNLFIADYNNSRIRAIRGPIP
jgi:sugar lactone lactonase YvrE